MQGPAGNIVLIAASSKTVICRSHVHYSNKPFLVGSVNYKFVFLGSNASRTASPIKVSKVNMTANDKNAVIPSHGA